MTHRVTVRPWTSVARVGAVNHLLVECRVSTSSPVKWVVMTDTEAVQYRSLPSNFTIETFEISFEIR